MPAMSSKSPDEESATNLLPTRRNLLPTGLVQPKRWVWPERRPMNNQPTIYRYSVGIYRCRQGSVHRGTQLERRESSDNRQMNFPNRQISPSSHEQVAMMQKLLTGRVRLI